MNADNITVAITAPSCQIATLVLRRCTHNSLVRQLRRISQIPFRELGRLEPYLLWATQIGFR
jgi:hypothetical protein